MSAINQSESFLQGSVSEKIEAIYQSDYFLQVSASAKTACENMILQKTKMDSLFQSMDEILISYPNCFMTCPNSIYDLERQYHTCSKDHFEASLRHDYYLQTLRDAKSLIEKIAAHTSLKSCGIRSNIPLPSPYRSIPLSGGKGRRIYPCDKAWDNLVKQEREKKL